MSKSLYEFEIAKNSYYKAGSQVGDKFRGVEVDDKVIENLMAKGAITNVKNLDEGKKVDADEVEPDLSADALEYQKLNAADVVAKVESGELSPDEAERLEGEIGKDRSTVANAVKAAREAATA